MDQFDFTALPALNKARVLDLAQGGYLDKRENLILMGNSGTGKTHLATALGLIACQQGRKVRFFTAAVKLGAMLDAVPLSEKRASSANLQPSPPASQKIGCMRTPRLNDRTGPGHLPLAMFGGAAGLGPWHR